MPTLTTIVRNRRIELAVPEDWPDGMAVDVLPRSAVSDDDRPMTPQEIAAMVARMETFLPVEWSEEERAAWDAERATRKAAEIATFDSRMEELRRVWG